MEKENERIVENLIGFFSILLFGWLIYKLTYFEFLRNIFEKNFGKYAILNLFTFTIISLFVLFLIYLIINRIYSFKKEKPNWWIWGSILCMLFFFCVGFFFIDSQFGNKDIRFNLNDDVAHKQVGTINCTNHRGALLVTDNVNCEISPKLTILNAAVDFDMENGGLVSKTMENEKQLSFLVIPGISKITFKLRGIDEKGDIRLLSTAAPYEFLTEEKYQKNKENFILYLIALFGIVLFSVPSMVNNFKNISEK